MHGKLMMISAAAALFSVTSVQAEVMLTDVIGDNAVLQRGMKVPIWGEASPGEQVTVAFAGQTQRTKADRFGRWRVELEPMAASATGRTLTVSGESGEVEARDVRVGDVWLYLVRSFHLNNAGPQRGWEPPASELPPIAFCRRSNLWPDRAHAVRPQAPMHSGSGASWGLYQPPGKYFANYAYYLGVGVGRETGAPVGVMGLGGTHLASMTPPQGFAHYPPALADLARQVQTWAPSTPAGREAYLRRLDEIRRWSAETRSTLAREQVTHENLADAPLLPGPPAFERAATTQYNEVIHRFMPAAMRGVIIQPLEHDLGDPHYAAKLAALIQGLREVMYARDAPICIVQAHSPHHYERGDGDGGEAQWPAMRQAQASVMGELPNVTVVATYDADPKHREAMIMKQAMRVAQWATAVVHGEALRTGPTVAAVAKADGKIVVKFDQVGAGLMAGEQEAMAPQIKPTGDKAVRGFELAGEDGPWHAATALITGVDTVVVTSEAVAAPTRVRYAWSAAPHEANLYNKAGFGALPFVR